MIVHGSPFYSSVSPKFCTIDYVSLEKQSIKAFTCLVAHSSDNPDRLQYESHWVHQAVKSNPLSTCKSSFGRSPCRKVYVDGGVVIVELLAKMAGNNTILIDD